MKYPFNLHENVTLTVKDSLGKILEEIQLPNLFVDTGISRVRDLLGGASSSAFTHIAIGTGTTSPVAGDTALETEVDRLSATVTYPSASEVQFQSAFTFVSAGTASETGLFDAVSAGTMANRATFTTLNIPASGTLTVTITFTIT